MVASASSHEQVIYEQREEDERRAREGENPAIDEAPAWSPPPADFILARGATLDEAIVRARSMKTSTRAERGVKVLDDGSPRTEVFVAANLEAARMRAKAAVRADAQLLDQSETPPETDTITVRARSERKARKLTEKQLPASGEMEIKSIASLADREGGNGSWLSRLLRGKTRTFQVELSGRAAIRVRYRLPVLVELELER